jgi:mRNA interferase MazF
MRRKGKGEIWLYRDPDSNKRRPVVIIANGGTAVDIDLTIAKITSNQKLRNEFDIPIEHWEEAGLVKPSVVRCSKIRTVKENELLFQFGSLTEDDLKKVMDAVIKYITS